MDMAAAISKTRPHLVMDTDFLVIDYSDGNGPQLEWYADEPPPTNEELGTAFLEISKEDKKTEMKQAAVGSAIDQSPDPDVQTVEDLFLLVLPALYSQATAASSDQRAAPQANLSSMVGNFERYYLKKAQIESATSEEEIAAVSWES